MPVHNIQLIPIPMWIYDVETLRFLAVNDAAVAHYGYSREEFEALTVMDVRPAPDRAIFLEANETLKRTQQSLSKRPYNHQKKNGEVIHVEVSAKLLKEGGKLIVLAIVHDISSLVNNQRIADEHKQRLLASERRFKALVQGGSDLLAIIDVNGCFTFASDSYKTILGYEPETLHNQCMFDYIHKNDREKIIKQLQQLKCGERLELEPFRVYHRKKQWRWISTIITNFIDDDAVQGIIANSKDITEAVLKKKELRTRNKALQEIAWAQSHQVRAPLSRVLALTDLLKRKTEIAEEEKVLLKHLSDSALELDDMVKAIIKKVEQRHKLR